MLKRLALFASLGFLGACATALPAQDRNRSITLAWDLKPTKSVVKTEAASQGDVLLTWHASARGSHRLNDGTPLVSSETPFGIMYCSFGTEGRCYEDRDGNQRLDHQWDLGEGTNVQISPFVARAPQPLESELSYEATPTDQIVSVLNRTAALIYDGPREGILADDGVTFDTMLGQLAFGWLDESDTRSPAANAWRRLQVVPVAILSEKTLRTKVVELNLIYSVDHATMDGIISVDLEAGAVEGYGPRQRLTFDILPTDAKEQPESQPTESAT